MKAFGLGASSPTLYKMATKMASPAMSPFTKDHKISNGPGPLKAWTEARDFPAPNKDRFRDWFKHHEKGGEE